MKKKPGAVVAADVRDEKKSYEKIKRRRPRHAVFHAAALHVLQQHDTYYIYMCVCVCCTVAFKRTHRRQWARACLLSVKSRDS